MLLTNLYAMCQLSSPSDYPIRWLNWYIWDFMEKTKEGTGTFGEMLIHYRRERMEAFAAMADFFAANQSEEIAVSCHDR